MPSPSTDFAICSSCHKKYKNKPTLAGKTVACSCGGKVTFPKLPANPLPPLATTSSDAPRRTAPPPARPASSDDSLDFKEPPPARHVESQSNIDRAADSTPCPKCKAPMPIGAVLCTNCGFNVKVGKRLKTSVVNEPDETEEADIADDAPPRRSFFTPRIIIAIVAGLVVIAGVACYYFFAS